MTWGAFGLANLTSVWQPNLEQKGKLSEYTPSQPSIGCFISTKQACQETSGHLNKTIRSDSF